MVIRQPGLFAQPVAVPAGFRYADNFVSAAEEAALLARIGRLPFANARYKEWTANRRIVSYGGRYDFSTSELLPASPIPPFLLDPRTAAAGFIGVPAAELTHALVAEYRAATELGWHRDVPEFELVGRKLLLHLRHSRRPWRSSASRSRGRRGCGCADIRTSHGPGNARWPCSSLLVRSTR